MLRVYEDRHYVDRDARDAANRPLIVINPTEDLRVTSMPFHTSGLPVSHLGLASEDVDHIHRGCGFSV